MGRVNTTVDGARQTSSSYRGYSGNRDEVYVDPDMIGGIDISKGPAEGTGTGAIGGNINFRTLEAQDIVKNGNTHGVRFKGSLGNNTVAPRAPNRLATSTPNQVVEERSSAFNADMYSGSFALAAQKENYEFVTAYSKRVQGNYFVGTKAPAGVAFRTGNATWDTRYANARVSPGMEAFNTSEDTDSFLAKGKVKWGDGHSLELGYLYFGSQYGEMTEFNIAPSGSVCRVWPDAAAANACGHLHNEIPLQAVRQSASECTRESVVHGRHHRRRQRTARNAHDRRRYRQSGDIRDSSW